jgi:hypothetical protein
VCVRLCVCAFYSMIFLSDLCGMVWFSVAQLSPSCVFTVSVLASSLLVCQQVVWT